MKRNTRILLKVTYHGETFWYRLLLRGFLLNFNGLRERDNRLDGSLAGGLALGSFLFVLEKCILPSLRIVNFVGKLGLEDLP